MRAMRMNRRVMVMTDENNDLLMYWTIYGLASLIAHHFPNLTIKTCTLRSLQQKSMYVKCLVTKTMF